MLVSLAQRSPDFWSWRGGVFWFTRESASIKTENISSSQHTLLKSVPKEIGGLPLEEILRLIKQIEAEGKEAPLWQHYTTVWLHLINNALAVPKIANSRLKHIKRLLRCKKLLEVKG
jgi:hypothetical protein